jgi:hypothetical protein
LSNSFINFYTSIVYARIHAQNAALVLFLSVSKWFPGCVGVCVLETRHSEAGRSHYEQTGPAVCHKLHSYRRSTGFPSPRFLGLAFISSLVLSVPRVCLVFRTIGLSFLSVFLSFALFLFVLYFFVSYISPFLYFFALFWFNRAVVTDTLHENLLCISTCIWSVTPS